MIRTSGMIIAWDDNHHTTEMHSFGSREMAQSMKHKSQQQTPQMQAYVTSLQ